MVGSKSDVGISRKVKDELAASHSLCQFLGIERVTFDQSEVSGTRCAVEEGGSASRKIVVADDLMVSAKQPVSEIATNKSGAARHKKAQQPSLSEKRSAKRGTDGIEGRASAQPTLA